MTDLSGVHNYTYDGIYQLTQATHPNMPTEQFGYDSVGNRISAEGETVGTLVATSYTYDLENRLSKVEYPGLVAQYKYDPFGRRIEKNVNGDITRYAYDSSKRMHKKEGRGMFKMTSYGSSNIRLVKILAMVVLSILSIGTFLISNLVLRKMGFTEEVSHRTLND